MIDKVDFFLGGKFDHWLGKVALHMDGYQFLLVGKRHEYFDTNIKRIRRVVVFNSHIQTYVGKRKSVIIYSGLFKVYCLTLTKQAIKLHNYIHSYSSFNP